MTIVVKEITIKSSFCNGVNNHEQKVDIEKLKDEILNECKYEVKKLLKKQRER